MCWQHRQSNSVSDTATGRLIAKCNSKSRAIQPAAPAGAGLRLQYRPSHMQQMPYSIPLLLLRSFKRHSRHRSRKKQLDLQTLHNDSAKTSAGTIADQQVRLRASQPALCILQSNADALSPKVHELRQWLLLEKIDICLIQETKLIPKDSTPAFPDFSAIRQGCPSSHRGGGLVTLVK